MAEETKEPATQATESKVPPSEPKAEETKAVGTTEATPEEDPQLKIYQDALRKVLGVKDGEEIGDIDKRMTELEQKNENIMQAAKSSIITANINAMQGYDTKLLRRIIDLNGVEVDENGNITGLDDAVKAAAKEYPAVKLFAKSPYIPANPATNTTSSLTMNDLIRRRN